MLKTGGSSLKMTLNLAFHLDFVYYASIEKYAPV
jgi:hypothetical protein